MRADEEGTPLLFSGQVRDVDGNPLAGAEIDIWQADDEGYYSGFAPHIPEGTCAAWSSPTTRAGSRSAPSSPRRTRSRPTGRPGSSSGLPAGTPGGLPTCTCSCRRPGTGTITTQLYFAGGEWLDSDVAEATKPELILDPKEGDGTNAVTYDFVLERAVISAAPAGRA